jgi:hypothetical protein
MFADSPYLQLDDGTFDDEDCNQDSVNEVDIVDIGRFMAMDEDNRFNNVNVSKDHPHPWIEP